MNEYEGMHPVPTPEEQGSPESLLLYCARRLLACNPFYLVSAACLLYGLYRLTVDPAFQREGLCQLAMIFGSLQVYEILLVGTAIFLAWRRIWYDSTLLVSLESMLVLVPFILVTLAAFLGDRAAWIVCGSGAALAAGKFWTLKQRIPKLNLPGRLLGIGSIILVANLAAPFVFRTIHETHADALAQPSRVGWLVVLPLLLGLVNLVRRPTHWGGVAAQRSWLPLVFASVWIVVSAVHLWCIGYIYDLEWRPCLLAPLLWVVTWTLFNRLSDFAPRLPDEWRTAAVMLPSLAAWLGAWEGTSEIVLALAGLNAALYAGLYLQDRDNRLCYHLMLISLTTVVAAMPESLGRILIPDYSRDLCVMGAGAGYIILRAVLTRDLRWGLAGAVATALVTNGLLQHTASATQLAIQAALVFTLLHSLRWQDLQYSYAGVLRNCAAVVWIGHSIAWVHGDAGLAGWSTSGLAVFVLGCYLLTWLIWHCWASRVVAGSALLVLLLMPGKFLAISAKAAPTGLLAILSAFALFGLGTVIALTRDKWNPPSRSP